MATWPSHFSPAGIQRLASIPLEYPFTHSPSTSCGCRTPLPPPFPNPGVQPPHSPHAQPLRQLRCVAFSLLSRMSIPRSMPTTPKLFTSCGHAAISPTFPGTCPLRPCSSPGSYYYVAFSATLVSPSHPSHQLWPHDAKYADPTICGCTHDYAHYAQTTPSPDHTLRLVDHWRTPIIMPSTLLHSTPFRPAFGWGYAVISPTLHHAHHI